MVVGNFNYHQILFALDTFKLNDEKLSYLEKIQEELNRITDCFESQKSLPLKMYASKNMNISGNCNELREFIKKQFEMLTTNPYDNRYPGEGELRALVGSELMNYKKLLGIVNDEIKDLCKAIKTQNYISEKVKKIEQNFISPKKITPNYISKLLKNENDKIIWDNSIGELIDLIKIIIVLELDPNLDEDKISSLICNRFVNSRKEQYIPIQVEKVYDMLQSTFWLNSRSLSPKYFQ